MALALALLLAAPTGLATWSAFGSSEPDNAHDSPSFLWFDAPGTDGLVYFNHFEDERGATNPNAGIVPTRLAVPGTSHPVAMLGVWLDCNGDNYVGLAESALEEYPSQMLSNTTRCPPGSQHNNDGWVTELLWIGTNHVSNGQYPAQLDSRMIIDNASMVWGDFGLPDDPKDARDGACILSPAHGTLHSTGGLLDFLDCEDAYAVYNAYDAIILGGTPGGFGIGEPTPGLDPQNQLKLAEPNCDGTPGCAHWESPHVLNRPTFGADENEGGHPILAVQDCSRGGSFPRPLPPNGFTLNPAGSIAASVTELREETLDDCHASPDEAGFYSCYQPDGLGVCESSSFSGHSDKGQLKTTPNFVLNFTGPLLAPLGGRGWEANLVGLDTGIGPAAGGAPFCLGLSRFGCQELLGSDVWSASVTQLATRPSLVRGDLARGSLRLEGARYATFYASISSDDGAAPGFATYGAAQCPDIGAGAATPNGWSCDPNQWYLDAKGNVPAELGWFPHAKVGDHYQLRDVDCDDGTPTPRVHVPTGTPLDATTSCDR